MMKRGRYWMICEVMDRRQMPCVFDEQSALKLGDPPRCIRHGALVFSHSEFDGALSREEVKRRIKEWK